MKPQNKSGVPPSTKIKLKSLDRKVIRIGQFPHEGEDGGDKVPHLREKHFPACHHRACKAQHSDELEVALACGSTLLLRPFTCVMQTTYPQDLFLAQSDHVLLVGCRASVLHGNRAINVELLELFLVVHVVLVNRRNDRFVMFALHD